MMKRIFSILLVAALLLGMMPVSAAAAETEGIFTYSVFNGEATVTGVSSSGGTEVTIPTTLGGYPVTAIGSSAFNAAGWVTKVTLPEGVTSISGSAFTYASRLTSVQLPSSLQSIGSYAFSNCYALTDITLPANLTSIGTYAFNQTGLASVSIPAGVTAIADGVFQSCGSLTNVQFHDNVTDIGINAFYNCEKLEVSALPSGLKTIGASAFSGCDALTALVIPDSVTTIGDEAFATCEGLTTVTIGSGAAQIPGNAFRYCAALEAFSVAAGNENFRAQNGFLYNKDKTSLICAPKTITGCEIPAGVLEIGPGAFNSCWELSTVTIPEGVTTISASAFRECENLSSLNIPASVNSIGEYAFIFSGITELTFAGNAPAMDKNALNGLESIAKYNLGSSGWEEAITQQYGGIITWTGVCTNHTYDREVAEDAYLKTEATCTSPAIYYKSCACGEEGTETFEHGEINEANHAFDANTHACACGVYGGTCGENLTWVLDEEGTLTISGTGEMENYTYDSIPWYQIRMDIKQIVIGEGVTGIGSEAFNECSNLTSITIPDGLTSIGEGAFANCVSLTDITLPDSLSSIDEAAFASCKSLMSLTIPEGVTDIADGAFFNCSNMTSITFLGNAPTFMNGVFSTCCLVAYYPRTAEGWTEGVKQQYGGTVTWKAYCPDDIHVFDQQVAENAYLAKPANCQLAAEYYYSCVCGEKGYRTFASGKPSHDYVSGICSRCGLARELPQGLRYSISGNKVTITGYSGSLSELDIPAIIEDKPVTGIGSEAFRDCSRLTRITLPNSITDIGNSAFYGCSGLTSITLPDSITSIGSYAFRECNSLTSITLPPNVTCISYGMFYECANLANITIPEGVTCIDYDAFFSCIKLTEITLPDTITDIKGGAFWQCSGLKNIAIPKGVTSIGTQTFSGCNNLVSITIPESVTSIGNTAFDGCRSLTSVTIPEAVTNIGDWAFHYCDSLTSITIPKGVTSIGYNAFASCSGLTSITLPEGVTSIGESAFDGCDSLTSITIPKGVTSIGKSAFYGCRGLTSVTFTGDAPTFGDDVFYWCNLTAYYPRTASGWTAEVMQPYGGTVTWKAYCQDDAHVFDQQKIDAEYLVSAATCTSKAVYHFSCACGEEGTETFEYGEISGHSPDTNNQCTVCGYIGGTCGENLTWVLDEEGILTISGTGEMTNFTNTIPWKAHRKQIKSVIISEGVTSIGELAFFSCSNLTSATIPEGVTSIGKSAFDCCDSLTSITIPNGVTSIGEAAFYGCEQLTEITLPNSVTVIGAAAFADCWSLTSVALPENLSSIADSLFFCCKRLTNITIPDCVTSIGHEAFHSCVGLTNISLPHDIRSIGEHVFSYCNNLTSITFTGNAPTFEFDVFYECQITVSYPRTASGWTEEVKQQYGGTITWEMYCPDGIHVYDQQKAEEQYLVTTATCTQKEVYHYSCACGAEGEETFEYGEIEGHSPDANYKCTVCGHIGGACGSNLIWTLDEEGTLTISGQGAMVDFDFGDEPWAAYELEVKWVVFEEGVTSVGENAFVTYENLIGITIPEGFLSLNDYTFVSCDNLISVTIPKSVTYIGVDVFVDCESLTGIWVDENNPAYSNDSHGVLFDKEQTWLLRAPASLPSNYTIPDSVANIEDYAFCVCDNLTNVTIPNSVTYIGFSAFSGCERLSSVVLSNNITHISTCMFSECSSLTSITIPESVTSIDGFAFRGCTSLESITIPKSVTNIQYRTFAECTSLKTIYFEDDLPTIGEEVFLGVAATAYYPANNTTWTADKLQNYGGTISWKPYCPNDAHVYNQQKAEAQYMVTAATCTKKAVYNYSCACGAEGEETFEYGNVLNHTPDAKFKCTACGYIGGACGSNLTWTLNEEGTLTISGEGNMADFNPEEVPWKAYESTIRKVVIEEGVTSIGTNAFVTYENLVSITIPEGFLSFSDNAFANCDRLISVTIPDSVVDIGCDAFVDCNSLTGIWVNENNSAYSNDSYGVLFNKDKTTLLRVPAGISGSYAVPDSVINVEELAFCNCDNLTNITIPNSVAYIGSMAFSGCDRLTSVVIPNGVTIISWSTFGGCTSLTSVTIPENVTSIDGFAFRGCSSLESITIPKSVANIGYRVFDECTSLKTIYFEGDLPTIGEEVFLGVAATAYYPANNTTWTADKLQNYGGTISWKPYCPNDAHVYNQQKAEAQYLVSEATCTKKAVYNKSCICGAEGSETFEYGNVKQHVYNQQKIEAQYLVSEATCTKKAVYNKSCICGAEGSETFEYGNLKQHVYNQQKVEAQYLVSEATCTKKAVYNKSCICGAEGSEIFEYGDVKPHTHESKITAPTCTVKGYTTHTCACGDSYVDTYVKELGHDMGQWQTVKAATCTENGSKRRDCSRCYHYETAEILTSDHDYKSVVTAPSCTEKGYTTRTCSTCGDSYVDTYVKELGHDWSEWSVVTEPTPTAGGEECRGCFRCHYLEGRPIEYQGKALILTDTELAKQSVVYINGLPYPVQGEGTNRYVELPTEEDCMMVTYTYHTGDPNDVHTQYPTGMKAYAVKNGKITHIPELDNILRYSGSSIRITGTKGIRMITSLAKDAKAALTANGLAGYTLVEYGTALCWASEIAEGDALVLGRPFTRSNYAYKKGVADPVFAFTNDLVQYTNVLVGFNLDQCKDDIAMRPYIILQDANGEQITLYGGTIYRSIGYIAYQNRNVFQPGNASYNYVWEIIHHVYGDKYDADYKG